MRCSSHPECYDPTGGNALNKAVPMAHLVIALRTSGPASAGKSTGSAERRRHDAPAVPKPPRELRSRSEEGNPLLERLLLAQRRTR